MSDISLFGRLHCSNVVLNMYYDSSFFPNKIEWNKLSSC
jgi:hypothetical protein